MVHTLVRTFSTYYNYLSNSLQSKLPIPEAFSANSHSVYLRGGMEQWRLMERNAPLFLDQPPRLWDGEEGL